MGVTLNEGNVKWGYHIKLRLRDTLEPSIVKYFYFSLFLWFVPTTIFIGTTAKNTVPTFTALPLRMAWKWGLYQEIQLLLHLTWLQYYKIEIRDTVPHSTA